MQACIYLRSSVPFPPAKTSTFSNPLFSVKENVKTSLSCVFIKAAASDDNVSIEDSFSHCCDDDKSVGLLRAGYEDVPMVTLDSMQRANSTLKDFCKSYFMFHDMDVNSAESIFKYLPLLSFTESYIYQLDNKNEKLVHSPCSETSDFPFKKLFVLLEGYGLLTDRIRNELTNGQEYWVLERKLCWALTRKQEIQIEDVMKANYLRSTDYRVLNLLLYKLNGKEVNETHMEFMSTSEFLGEISDDLLDYEDDVLHNTFNMLRMFIGIYGSSLGPSLFANKIKETQEKYRYLLSLLDPQLAVKYQKGREESAIQSGEELAARLGKWSMPRVIEDEDLYRYEISNARFIKR